MIYKEKKNIQKVLWISLGISKIYNTSNYNTSLLNGEIYFYENNSFSVIGLIEIEALNISYPILSNMNNELLKLAPCRFYGPLPNEIRKSMYCRS